MKRCKHFFQWNYKKRKIDCMHCGYHDDNRQNAHAYSPEEFKEILADIGGEFMSGSLYFKDRDPSRYRSK